MSCKSCASIPKQTKFDPLGRWTATEKYAYSEAWSLILMRYLVWVDANNYGESNRHEITRMAQRMDAAGESPHCRGLSYHEIAKQIAITLESER